MLRARGDCCAVPHKHIFSPGLISHLYVSSLPPIGPHTFWRSGAQSTDLVVRQEGREA